MPSRTLGTYLYCIAPAEPSAIWARPLRSAGVGPVGGRPRVIGEGDLVAVVSDAPADVYTITRAALLAHEEVIAEAMERADVLPVQFGTVADSDEAIQRHLLRREAPALRRQLNRVHGCVEFSVKVLWEREPLFAEIAAHDADIRELRDDLARGDSTSSTYFQQIQLGELVADAIERMRARESAEWLAALRPLAREAHSSLPIADTMALNAAFLVARGTAETFAERVGVLRQSQHGRLIVRCTGPLPPYSFVDLATSVKEAGHGVAH